MIMRLLLFLVIVLQYSPSKASIVIHNGLTHIYKVKGGQVYKGKVSLENTASAPQAVKIYLQDLSYQSDGTVNYSAPLNSKTSNAGWVRLSSNLLTLKGKEKADLLYEINVPEHPGRAGSYWSIIMIEPEEELKPTNEKVNLSISSVVRYAVQVITDYSTEDLKPGLRFEHIKVDREGSRRFLKIALANIGPVFCKPAAMVEIYDHKEGKKRGTYSSLPMGLLPNNSKSFIIDISQVPPGRYTAAVMAADENENAFALNVELEIKND